MIYHTQGEQANHYATDTVDLFEHYKQLHNPKTKWSKLNKSCTLNTCMYNDQIIPLGYSKTFSYLVLISNIYLSFQAGSVGDLFWAIVRYSPVLSSLVIFTFHFRLGQLEISFRL